MFSFKQSDRLIVLKHVYSIEDTYLYPQKLMFYLMQTDPIIHDTIIENSLNQWQTIYALIIVLTNQYNVTLKCQILNTLITNESPVPDAHLAQPLLKLQGAVQQGKYTYNRKSWWWQLCNK